MSLTSEKEREELNILYVLPEGVLCILDKKSLKKGKKQK